MSSDVAHARPEAKDQPAALEHGLEAWLWATPNSNRVSILFEELGLDYAVHGVNIRRKEQFAPAILAMNPYGKIPIVRWRDAEGEHVLFESGAILLDFAERHGALLPASGAPRRSALAWLMVALTGLGPMTGQAHHWTDLAPEKPEAAIAHTVGAVRRIYALLEQRLAAEAYLAGEYSIADIAAYPWIARSDWARLDLADYPHLARWRDRLAARPAVARGMAVPHGARLEG
jgi:GST-like protein